MEFLQERAGIAEAHAARIGSRALARRVDRADGQLLQDAAAALRVVLMRMRQKDGRDLADPMMQQIWHGNPRADIETALARAARVKEQRPARWRHDERGIALPHIDEVDGETVRRDCTVKRDGSRQHEEQCERRPTPGREAGPQPFALLFSEQQRAQCKVVECGRRPCHRCDIDDAARQPCEHVHELRCES